MARLYRLDDPDFMARLRPVCRLEAGQTTRDCAAGSAGDNGTGRLDLADLIMTDEGRATWLRAVGAKLGARTPDEGQLLFHQIIDPAIDDLNRGVDDPRSEEAAMADKKDCGCGRADHEHDDHADDDIYDGSSLWGALSQAAQHRRAREQLGQPSSFRGGATVDRSDSTAASNSTDEDDAKRALAQQSRNMWRSK